MACAGFLAVLVWAASALAAPSVYDLSPDRAFAGDGAFVLVVDGEGFAQGSQVLWGGSPRATTWVSSNRLTAAIGKADADNAANVSVQVRDGGETSGAVTFPVVNPTPYPYDFTPPNRVKGSGRFILTITGSGFVRGSKVLWDGSERTTEYVDHRTLTADILTADVATRRVASVRVVNPPPTPYGGLSYSQDFYITDPLPTITGVNPAQGTVGAAQTTLAITGQNFAPGARVIWQVCSGAFEWNCSYDENRGQFVSATEMRVPVTAAELAVPGRAYFSIRNPNGYPEETETRTWVIGQAPNTAPAMPAEVQVLGRNDATGAVQPFVSAPFVWPGTVLSGRARFADKEGGPLTIEVNWRYINGGYQDYRLLTKTVPGPGVYDFPLPNLGAGAFVARVRTRDSDGVAGDWRFLFPSDPDWTVLSGQPPLVSASTPTGATAGGGPRTITIDGTGFTPGAVAQWNGEPRVTTFVSDTRLLVSIPGSDLASPGRASIRVANAGFNVPLGAQLSNATAFEVIGATPPSVPLPFNLLAPTVSGSPQVGGALACGTGTWANSPTAFAVAWLRDGVLLPAADAPTYLVRSTDAGRLLSCRVTAVNLGGPGIAVSDSVVIGAAPLITPPGGGAGVSSVGPAVTIRPGTVAAFPRRVALIGPLSAVTGKPFRLALRFDRQARKLLVRLEIRRGGRFALLTSRRVSGIAPTLRVSLPRTGRQVLRITWKAGTAKVVSKTLVVLVRGRADSR